jgi:hypothetical protein
LFGANGYKSKVKTALTARFPKTAEFLRQQKEQDEGASKLATALQKLEAQAVIHKTADRIRKQRPEMFLATIHDSILIFPDDLCYAQHVFQDELRKLKINAKLKGQSL